jgi:crotonobetainyl-CoA:carnitine CoA-transferase CaiB-like acyl-CoA transferase
MQNFGLTWETLHEWNPQLLVVRMPAFGLDGPWKDRAGWASSVDQVSGMAWVTGYPDFPIVVRAACDPIGGMHAAFAVMLGLESRRRTKRGQLIEVPLVEPALTVAAEQVIEYTAYGELLTACGNRGPYAAPQGIYPTATDDPLALAVATDAQWRALCELLGAPKWALEARFDTQAGRRDGHDLIDAELSKWTSGHSCSELVEVLVEAGIPASAVENGHRVRPHPQLEHRRFFQTLEHPVAGGVDYPVLPMKFSELGPELHRSPPPTLGQHNEEVLQGELGMTADELEELREQQTIGTAPSFL